MENSVVIKGNKNGIVVILDSNISFDSLKIDVAHKFSDSAKFLGNCKTALTFEGRELSEGEAMELLEIIQSNSQIDIVCLVDNNENRSKEFAHAIDEKLRENSLKYAQFFKGNLRSGQVLEYDSSVIVLGDVNPGASVVSTGNIVVLGSLKGMAIAGQGGNRNAFVIALDMNPMQIRIDDVIARSPDAPEKDLDTKNKIAFMEDGNIYIEPLEKGIFNEIHLF